MTQQAQHAQPATEKPGAAHNAVVLRGRVSSAPMDRVLPSGDSIWTFRMVIARERSPMTAKSKQTSDWVDCVAWGARARRGVSTWRVGDTVAIEGALRRRFFRADGQTSTRVEVEVLAGRVVARGP